jgi:hypothetical protein
VQLAVDRSVKDTAEYSDNDNRQGKNYNRLTQLVLQSNSLSICLYVL